MMSSRCPACGTVYQGEATVCARDGTPLLEPLAAARAPASAARGGEDAGTRGSADADLSGTVLDGRYRVEHKVGEGGMSRVYLGHDLSSGERVAIKILAATLAHDRSSMARLRREAGLGSRLAHPGICKIQRLGETDEGLVYAVMPFLEGEILADREHRLGVLPLEEAVRVASDVAAGLHAAHELGIIHRDLKPENVMVVQDDAGERAVVMDFGLAKERRAAPGLEKLTVTGTIVGTPEFMSPEQIRGMPLDGRTDIYSLALLTFEMLTGKLPFAGRTQQEMMVNRLRSEPMPLRRARPELGYAGAVERVLLKGMARDPDARFATAPQFARALSDAASGTGDPGGRGFVGELLARLFGR